MTSVSASFPFSPRAALLEPRTPLHMNRRVLIVASVAGFHAAALWALQAGFVRPAVEPVTPVEVMVEFIELPQPQVAPVPEPAPKPPKPDPVEQPKPRPKPTPKPTPKPVPKPTIDPVPLPVPSPPTVESEVPEQAPVVSAPVEATPARSAAPPAPPAPPKIELPSSHATYLNNTPPAYPPLSKRMGEQGRVVIRALISAEGIAGQASVKTSSGYQRLDQTALRTVLQWRYVPGKRAGVPEAMWFNIPLDFVLE